MIIFDLDGTLADCEHRRHFVDRSKYKCPHHNQDSSCIACVECHWKPDWKAFFEECDKDAPINPTIKVLRSFIGLKEIEIWSGRCESTRKKTMQWLTEHVFGDQDHCNLRMRTIYDSTPDDVMKENWLDQLWIAGEKVEFVFDDRPKVVAMWRRRDVFVFDCNQTGKEF